MSHHSSSVNGEGTSHKDPLSRILNELSSLKLWKEKQERNEKVAKEELVLDVFQLTTIYVLCNYEWIVEIFLVKITLWYVSS